MKKIVCLSFCFLATVFTAANAMPNNGFYIGAEGGMSLISAPGTPDIPISVGGVPFLTIGTKTNKGFATGAYLGYLTPINNKFSLGGQLGFHYNGGANYFYINNNLFSVRSFDIRLRSTDVSATLAGRYQFANRWSGMFNAGITRVSQKLEFIDFGGVSFVGVQTPGIQPESTLIKFKPIVAASIGYRFGRGTELYLKTRYIAGSSDNNFENQHIAGVLSGLVGVRYLF